MSLVTDDQLTVDGADATPDVTHVNGEQETEYMFGRLTFREGDTITEAVGRFNQFNAMQIIVDDATGAKPMRGSFDAIDPLSFAAVVERSTGSSVVHESPALVRIGPHEPRSH